MDVGLYPVKNYKPSAIKLLKLLGKDSYLDFTQAHPDAAEGFEHFDEMYTIKTILVDRLELMKCKDPLTGTEITSAVIALLADYPKNWVSDEIARKMIEINIQVDEVSEALNPWERVFFRLKNKEFTIEKLDELLIQSGFSPISSKVRHEVETWLVNPEKVIESQAIVFNKLFESRVISIYHDSDTNSSIDILVALYNSLSKEDKITEYQEIGYDALEQFYEERLASLIDGSEQEDAEFLATKLSGKDLNLCLFLHQNISYRYFCDGGYDIDNLSEVMPNFDKFMEIIGRPERAFMVADYDDEGVVANYIAADPVALKNLSDFLGVRFVKVEYTLANIIATKLFAYPDKVDFAFIKQHQLYLTKNNLARYQNIEKACNIVLAEDMECELPYLHEAISLSLAEKSKVTCPKLTSATLYLKKDSKIYCPVLTKADVLSIQAYSRVDLPKLRTVSTQLALGSSVTYSSQTLEFASTLNLKENTKLIVPNLRRINRLVMHPSAELVSNVSFEGYEADKKVNPITGEIDWWLLIKNQLEESQYLQPKNREASTKAVIGFLGKLLSIFRK